MQSVQSNVAELKSLVASNNYAAARKCLSTIKLSLLALPSLPPCAGEFGGVSASQASSERSVAVEALEIGALLSIKEEDTGAFERYVAMLQPFYTSYSSTAIAKGGISLSELRGKILGLNLMNLLVEGGRLAEFHAVIELLSEKESKHACVAFPIQLEQKLMVGSYNDVLNASKKMPDEAFGFFIGQLLQTVRSSIAECAEVAYREMSVSAAMKMMKFDSEKELKEFVEEFNEDWEIEGGKIVFQAPVVGRRAEDIPSMNLISQSIGYAGEMERIV